MLERDFTSEQIMFREAYRKFLATEIVPYMEDWRSEGIVDREAFRKAGEQGFLMIWPHEKYGGSGDDDFRFEQIIMEEGAYARVGDWAATLHSRLVGPYFTRFGSQEQCDRFLPDCVSGKKILAVAMTEPDAGSDLAGMRTVAVEEHDHWRLTGAKTYITNGINSDLVIVAAKIDPENNPHAMTLFIVERGMEGFERGRNLKKAGRHSQDTAELFFSDVRIPAENLLGEENKGFYYMMFNLPQERLNIAISAVAGTQYAFDLTLEYVKERKAFGKAIGSFQNSRFKMAEIATELQFAWAFIDKCSLALTRGELTAEEAAMAKWWTTELQKRAIDQCLQLHGGYGYMDEYPISRLWRDGRVQSIYGGTTEIMKEIIGRNLGL